MAAAGKAKVSDFWYRHKDTAPSTAEVAMDALSQPHNASVMFCLFLTAKFAEGYLF